MSQKPKYEEAPERKNMQFDIPILKLELQGIRNTILSALHQSQKDLEALVNVGISQVLENLPALIVVKVRRALDAGIDQAVTEATTEFFSPGGAGYDSILEEVASQYRARQVAKALEELRPRPSGQSSMVI